MKRRGHVELVGEDTPPEIREDDPLLDAYAVADLITGVSPEWVRRNVPGKLDLGHSTKRWFTSDVLRWIQSRREGGSR